MTRQVEQIESILVEAVEIAPEEQRRAFVNRVCGEDEALKRRVEELIENHFRAGRFLESPVPNVLAQLSDSNLPLFAEQPGTEIGPYKLVEQIGEGGMGLVFVAEQQQPVRRRVALKVIKPGMDTRQVVARFEAERQALALMDHPGIARIIDGGETSSGRPYFVMELVGGEPITEFCDQHQLTVRERLELFATVCDAVQHAHQKGVIHRDLKPSNVLVTSHPGAPGPIAKVIDFGIAKATGQQLTDKTLVTSVAQMIGTPMYMSPEQAQIGPGSSADIDTRTDIYSLGVLLFELLTGTTPFDKNRLRTATFDEIRRIIRDEDPPKPSTRLSALCGGVRNSGAESTGDAAAKASELGESAITDISANRRTDPKRLPRLFRGELDWIVMKALEKDRERRYDSASAFGLDLRRYLDGEAVLAGPPTVRYQLWKVVKRHRAPLLATAALIVILLGGIVGTTIGLIEARTQRAEALQARANEEVEKNRALAAEQLASARLVQLQGEIRRADEERAIAQAISNFLQQDLLSQADVEKQIGGVAAVQDPNIKVRTLLDRAGQAIESKFPNQPLVEASLRLTIAEAYMALGIADDAIGHAERSVEMRATHLAPDHRDTLASQEALALAYFDHGLREQGLALAEQVLEKRVATLGESDLDTVTSKFNVAYLYSVQRKFDRVRPLLEDVIRLRTAQFGPLDEMVLATRHNLAWWHKETGDYDRSIADFLELIETHKAAVGEHHSSTVMAQANLAIVYWTQGNPERAEPILRQAIDQFSTLFGENHPWTLARRVQFAGVLASLKKYRETITILENVLEKQKASQREDHPETLYCMSQLGRAMRDAGKPEQAVPILELSLQKCRALLAPDEWQVLSTMIELARTYSALNRFDEATQLLEEVLAKQRGQTGVDVVDIAYTMSILAGTYRAAGNIEQALPLREQSYEFYRMTFPPDSPSRLNPLRALATTLLDAGQTERACALFREYVDGQRSRLGADTIPFAIHLTELCRTLIKYEQYGEAELHLSECYAILKMHQPDAWGTFATQSLLGSTILEQGRYAEAEPLLLAGYEGVKQRENEIPPRLKFRLRVCLQRVVQLYERWGKPDIAVMWRSKLLQIEQQ